jgi:hypothetical protein
MVSALAGAGTVAVRGVEVGERGVVGFDVVLGVRDVVDEPGSVVIATVPVVVRLQPASAPTRISAAAAVRTSALIFATIGVRAS